jgi:DNA polymerase-1
MARVQHGREEMAKKKRPRLYLIDGNNYIYRAFHAIRHLTNSKGFPTNAVYGFTTMLLKVIRDEKPEYLAVAFDSRGDTTRHKIFPEYKATRPPMPDDLQPQVPIIHDLVGAFRIPVLEKPGYEADDLLATAALMGVEAGMEVVIVSGDKDLLQLVGKGVKVLDTMKDILYGPAQVEEKFGVSPGQLGDVLALAGDSVDNVPGVRGIGAKTAPELIRRYGSLDGLYENLDDLKGARRRKIEEGRDDAFLSKKLVTLIDDVPLGLMVEDFGAREPDREAALALFREMEFSRLMQEVAGPGKKSQRPREYRLVSTGEELAELAELLASSGGFAVDLETTHLEPMRAEIVGLSFSAREDKAFYVPVGHNYLGAPEQLPLETVLKVLGPVLTDPAVPKYGQNIKYDALVFQGAGLTLAGIDFDTMVASYVINPTRHRHNLTELALEYLDEKVSSYEDVAGKGKKQIPFSHVEVAAALEYAGEDADVTFRLTGTLRPKIEELSLGELYYGLELPLVQVLAAMERNGVLIDMQALRDLAKEVDGQLQELVRKIWTMAGVEFNLNSPKQLAEILFDRLGLPVVKKTKTGRSTDEGVLMQLAAGHELPAEVLSYRQLAKLKNTYLDVLPTLVNPRTGRVHTSFNQTVTATGRLSSSDPNLQNIPVRTELGRRIRQAFIASPGGVLLSADYSQIELRLLAHLSGDEGLLEAFRRGEDVHEQTATAIFGDGEGGVTEEQRRTAKTINFGIIYGMGAFGLSRQLRIDQKEAKEFIERYFERFPGVRAFLDSTLEKARIDGFVTTLLGRKRFLPELAARNRNVVQFAERMATNTPVQGSAADLIKKAMLEIHAELLRPAAEWGTLMVLQIHDELLFDVPEEEVDRLVAMVREKMEGVMDLAVPLTVDVGVGSNWDEAH